MSASRSGSLRGANADISIKSKTVGGGFFCYAKKIGLQMLNSGTRLEVNSCRGLSESFLPSDCNNCQCLSGECWAKLEHRVALRGESRPHDPHNITVVGVYKDSDGLALVYRPIFAVVNR